MTQELIDLAVHEMLTLVGSVIETRKGQAFNKAKCEFLPPLSVKLLLVIETRSHIFYLGQLIRFENTTSIFVDYEGRLQISNTQRHSMQFYSHPELDTPVRFVIS